jgi:deoxyribodipyrimidine photo-lyase
MEELGNSDKSLALSMKSVWSSTLYHLDDLDYDPQEYLPHIYGKFREKNQHVRVRNLLPTPGKKELPFMKQKNTWKDIPKLADFGFSKEEISKKPDSRACYDFHGGEDAGLKRIEEYIFKNKSVGTYAETRN